VQQGPSKHSFDEGKIAPQASIRSDRTVRNQGTTTVGEDRAKSEHEYHFDTQPHPVDTAFEQAATQLKKLPR